MSASAAGTPLLIPALAAGDRVQHQLLVVGREEKRTGGGDPFVVLTLRNRTGKIDTAPIWSNQITWADGAAVGKIVQAIGDVSIYPRTGKKQLAISGPVRVLPDQLFDPAEFLPSIDGDRERLWDYLDRERAGITSPALRAVLDVIFADDAFRVRFEQAPASTGGHHAKLGGLLLHVSEVVNIGKSAARTMRANPDLVVAGAMLHDIGKVESYEVGPGGFGFTPCGLLVGHVVMGVLMLERAMAALGREVCTPGQLLEVQHMILSHHGKLEHGSPVEPMTAEAEILHWADETSAKGADMMESLEDAEHFQGGGEFSDKRVFRLNRRIWRRPHRWD
jgi:3'-5' exoribonuclease